MTISQHCVCVLVVLGLSMPGAAAEWTSHIVRQFGGVEGEIRVPARFQVVTEEANSVALVPYLVYMPEKDRLLMLVTFQPRPMKDFHAMVTTSEDHGTTWSKPKVVLPGTDGAPTQGLGLSLTYLGQGQLLMHLGDSKGVRLFSSDYGSTWAKLGKVDPTPQGKAWHPWDPLLVERDKETGEVTRLLETGWNFFQSRDNRVSWEQGYLRFSTDKGRTWTKGVRVPQWKEVSEVALFRAANGNHLAACRPSIPEKYKQKNIDHWEGLGISISKDGGQTWSSVKKLYDWGRHHPSLVLMPSSEIVMTYVARKGYVMTPKGYPQFGIEAVVSRDHGETWDLDHRYLLHRWEATMKGFDALYQSPQGVSSVLLPDGKILTAFGTGYRSKGPAAKHRRDIGLVRWQLSGARLNDSNTIRTAAPDSDLRNIFDPLAGKPGGWKRDRE